MSMIDLKKPIKFVSEKATEDGWVATVVTDKGPGPYCLLGVATNPNPHTYSFPMQWRANGKSESVNNRWACPSYWDICNVPEKIKVDVWLNVFKMSDGNTKVEAYPSEQAAKCWGYFYNADAQISERSACLHVEAEVEPGFGITPPADGPQSC